MIRSKKKELICRLTGVHCPERIQSDEQLIRQNESPETRLDSQKKTSDTTTAIQTSKAAQFPGKANIKHPKANIKHAKDWKDIATREDRLAADLARVAYYDDDYHMSQTREAKQFTDEMMPRVYTMQEARGVMTFNEFLRQHGLNPSDSRVERIRARWDSAGDSAFYEGTNRIDVEEGILKREIDNVKLIASENEDLKMELAYITRKNKRIADKNKKALRSFSELLELPDGRETRSSLVSGTGVGIGIDGTFQNIQRDRVEANVLQNERTNLQNEIGHRITRESEIINENEARNMTQRLGKLHVGSKDGNVVEHQIEALVNTDVLHGWFYEPRFSSNHIRTYSKDGMLSIGHKGTEKWFDGFRPSADFIQNLSNASGYENVADLIYKLTGKNVHTRETMQSRDVIQMIVDSKMPVDINTGHSKGAAAAAINKKILKAKHDIYFNEAPTLIWKDGKSFITQDDYFGALTNLRNNNTNVIRKISEENGHSLSHFPPNEGYDSRYSGSKNLLRVPVNIINRPQSYQDAYAAYVNAYNKAITKTNQTPIQNFDNIPYVDSHTLEAPTNVSMNRFEFDEPLPVSTRGQTNAGDTGGGVGFHLSPPANLQSTEAQQMYEMDESPTPSMVELDDVPLEERPKIWTDDENVPLLSETTHEQNSKPTNGKARAAANFGGNIFAQAIGGNIASKYTDNSGLQGAGAGVGSALFNMAQGARKALALVDIPATASAFAATEYADHKLEPYVENDIQRGGESGAIGGGIGATITEILGSTITGARFGSYGGVPGLALGVGLGTLFGMGNAIYSKNVDTSIEKNNSDIKNDDQQSISAAG